MSEIKKLFHEKGMQKVLRPNERISLKNASIYLLDQGSMLLFSVKGQEGKRCLLTAVDEKSLLFPIHRQNQNEEVFAYAEQEGILYEIQEELFLSQLCHEEVEEAFLPLLEKWIVQFAPLLSAQIEIEVDHWAKDHQVLHLNEGEIFALSPGENQKVLWGNFDKEVIKFLGPPEIKIHEAHQSFPFLVHQFFLALEKGEVELKTTKQVIGEGSWNEGLREFHAFLLRFLEKREQKEFKEEKERFAEKEKLQSETLHSSFNQMAAVLKDEITEEQASSTDPLFEACRLVGLNMGLQMVLPERKPFKGTVKERLCRMGERSEARVRSASLSSNWWKKDVGALIAFYGKEKHPVALLQNRWGFYEMHDPFHKTKKRVTEETARFLSKEAYRFYPCFSDQLHEGKKAVMQFLCRTRKDLLLLGLYGLIAALIALFPPIAMAVLFNHAIPEANAPLVSQIFIGLLLAALSTSLFIYFRSLLLSRIGGIGAAELQASLWDRLLKLPANFFRRFSGGDLLTRVFIMDQLSPLFSSNVARVFLTGVFALFYFIAMAIYSVKLTLVSVLLLFIVAGITFFCARYKVRMQKATLNLQGQINGALVQILSGIAKLRVAGAENNAFSHWATLYAKSKQFEMKGQHAQGFVAATMAAFPLLSFLAVFAMMIHLEEKGGIEVGTFLGFNAAFLTFSAALLDLGNTLMQTAHVFPLVKRSRVILSEKQELLQSKVSPGKLTGDIRIDQLSFGYAEKGALALENISIKVHPYEMVGIVGPSGSGKSTLIRLILGFETPRSGAIYYNDKDLSHLNTNEVRKQIGVVLQGGGIIAGTLYQNLVAGGSYPQEEIDRAIYLSGFHRDLRLFPMGLHTVIPMNGETLSGGQKQRLLIARALLPRPKILLLDEATSALDNQSQNEISSNIDKLDVTRIVIAHRLSTIRHANRIYVIEQGRVIQSGTFDTLGKEPGLFSEMLKRQKL